MKRYWHNGQHDLTIYCGDCGRVLRNSRVVSRLSAGPVALVTDPPWPQGTGEELAANVCAVTDLLRELMNDLRDALQLEQLRRSVIHLGCDTDPRVLQYVAHELAFLRICSLEYVRPHYKGRILYNGDVAYVFGEAPRAYPGAGVLPGRCLYKTVEERIEGHPYPRRLAHVEWLVRWFTEPTDTVLDPFLGSGTTLVAAYRLGRKAVGIEVEKKYCALAAERLEKEMAQGRLFEPVEVAAPVQLPLEEGGPTDGGGERNQRRTDYH